MCKVIGLVGKLQSGKTTTANIIKNMYPNVIKLSFGDLLKEMLVKAELCKPEELWGDKTPHSRMMLQKIGTEIIRKQVSETFWIDKMAEKIRNVRNENPNLIIVIDDVRFKNEADLIKYFDGCLIRIKRPGLDTTKDENKHLSETEQDEIIVDHEILNDCVLELLENKVFQTLIKVTMVKH